MALARSVLDAQVVRLEQELKESEQRRAELEQRCAETPAEARVGMERVPQRSLRMVQNKTLA